MLSRALSTRGGLCMAEALSHTLGRPLASRYHARAPPFAALPLVYLGTDARHTWIALYVAQSSHHDSIVDPGMKGASTLTCCSHRDTNLARQSRRHPSFPRASNPSAAAWHSSQRRLKSFSFVGLHSAARIRTMRYAHEKSSSEVKLLRQGPSRGQS